MRAKEGSNLHKELLRRNRSIGRALSKIRKLQPRVAKRYRALLFERVRKIGLEITLDDDRLTKDVTFFAERADFSEELSRLESHLDQFLETTNKQLAIGRTLEFISQELGRELNTLSAKANDAEISQIVVRAKPSWKRSANKSTMWNETALMNIILGVTASIAAYKAADLASKLTKQDRSLHVLMTAGAAQFVTPLTLQTLTRHPVTTNIFDEKMSWYPGHIELADNADLVLIAPAPQTS
jgi:hypothetical protein